MPATKTTYVDLDYGLGTANIDPKTGIRYGVIGANSVNFDALYASQEFDYGEPTCGHCESPAVEYDEEKHSEYEPERSCGCCADYACESCKLYLDSDSVYAEEPLGWSIVSDGYKLSNCLDNDVFVLGSPYYTYAQFCSPCVPGAGNLDSPTELGQGAKCYALGPEWFDSDSPIPYTAYRVIDDSEVLNNG